MSQGRRTQQRAVTGPGFDLLVEALGDAGTATLWFHKAFRRHEALLQPFGDAETWLRDPGIPGLAPLTGELRDGAFSYAIKPALSVREVVDRLKISGHAGGPRATLDFLRAVGEVLVRSTRRGARVGMYAHGAVTPWTVLLDGDGAVQVLGFGVPRADVYAFLDDETVRLPGAALRYTPPEMLEDHALELSSDLLALALVAIELLTGHHAFVGDADEVLEQIHRGEGPVAMAELGEGYPAELVVLLARASSRSAGERFRRGNEFIRALDALGPLDGPSLAQVVRSAMEQEEADEPTTPDPTEEVPLELAEEVVVAEVELDDDEPEDVFDPEPTRALGAMEPVPPLSGGVNLERVKEHAAQVVERAGVVAARAQELVALCREEGRSLGAEAAADVDRAASAARRADKARDSARGAANLVEMDETAAEAQVTLTLVHGAARQADAALAAVVDALVDIRRSAHRIAGEMERVDAARERAEELVLRARGGVRAVARVADAIRSASNAGDLPAGAGERELAELRSRAERAMRVAEESSQALATATLAEVADAALARLDDAASAAVSAGEAAATLRESLAAEVDRVRLEALDTAQRGLRNLVERIDKLTDRLESAESANAVSPTPRAEAAIADARRIVAALDERRERAEQAVAAALEAETESSARQAAEDVRAAEREVQRDVPEAEERVDAAITATRLAAEEAARREAAQREARRLLEEAEAALTRVRDVVERLVADTEEIEGRHGRAAVREASAAWAELQRAGVEARGHSGRLNRAEGDAARREALDGVRDTTSEILSGAEGVLDKARTARESCNRELAELRRARQAAQALTDAVDEARASAEACREAVQQAQDELRRITLLVEGSGLDEVQSLRAEAAEIIDIAAYQASEATDAARQAKAQGFAEEAARYADTARSFSERIAEDLPAALQALERVATLVEEDADRRERATERLSECREQIDQTRTRLSEALASARHAAQGWAQESVREALDALSSLGPQLDRYAGRVEAAEERAGRARAAEEVESAAGEAQQAASLAEDLHGRIEALAAAVDAAVEGARDEEQALEAAQEAVRSARSRARAAADTLRNTLTEAQHDVLPHRARGSRVREGLLRLGAMVQEADGLEPELDLLVDAVRRAESRRRAEPLAQQAEAHAEALQALVDEATALAVETVEAAVAEASAREEEARRSREDASRRVRSAQEKVSEIEERARAAVDAARAEIEGSQADEAHDRFAAASRAVVRVATARERLDDLVDRLDADEPELLLPELPPLVDLAETCAADVHAAIEQAMDAARRAVEEASALKTVREEVATLGGRARAAVEVARVRSAEIAALVELAERESTREVAVRARDTVALAEKAAKKSAAAGPMVALVTELAAAEPIVRAARLSAERAEEVAASLADLLDEAQRRVDEEQVEAARRLDEARTDARHPLGEARAAVARAQGFVDAVEAEAREVSGPRVQAALAALRSAADDVRVRAGDTVRMADGLAAAIDLRGVELLAQSIQDGRDATIAALGEATRRQEEARAVIAGLRAEAAALQRALERVEEAAQSAQEAATGCRTTAEGLTERASALETPDEAVTALLAEMERVADRAETAAAEAFTCTLEATDVTRSGPAEDLAERAGAALKTAIEALASAVEVDKRGRAAIDAAHAEAARLAAEAAQSRRRLPRRRSGSRADRLRSRLEASGAPRPGADDRRDYAPRSRTRNSEVDEPPAAPQPPPPRPSADGGSSEDRIARLRQSLRAGSTSGPARSRSERMAERRAAGESRPARELRSAVSDDAEEQLTKPKRGRFSTGSQPVPPRAHTPEPQDESDTAAEKRRRKREALRARLRRSRHVDDE